MQKPDSFSAWFAERQASGGGAVSGAMAPAPTSFFGGLVGVGGASATADPEAGRAPPSPSATPAGSGAPSLLGFLPSSLLGGLGGGSGAPAAPAEPEWNCGMNAVQRFQAFGMLLLASLLLYLVSIFVFLPMVIIMPSKFATAFTFASIFWMAAFAILRGPRATLKGLFNDKEKRVFTAAYIGSLLLTLYSALFTSSYLLALLAICVQVGAMLWYSSSSIPGGTTAMAALTRWCFGGWVGAGGGLSGAAAGLAMRGAAAGVV